MANDINQFTFTGRLGADPESRVMPSGEPVANFTVACGKSWKDKGTGAKKEMTEWVRCSAFGKLAEICQEYLRKGSQVAAVGELRTRKWQDKQGNDRYTTEVIVNQMTLMGRAPEGADQQGQAKAAGRQQQQAATRAPAQQQQQPREELDDDIPF